MLAKFHKSQLTTEDTKDHRVSINSLRATDSQNSFTLIAIQVDMLPDFPLCSFVSFVVHCEPNDLPPWSSVPSVAKFSASAFKIKT
jgi:hypothetical protein